MADHWYDALKRGSDEIEISGRGTVRALDRVAGADLPTYRAASDPRGRELERLTRMNERLLIVMEEVLRLQSTTLERKMEGPPAQRELVIQGGAVDNEAIARVVRDTLDSQMKPVLTALLRLIEVNGGSVTPRNAIAIIGQPVESPPAQAAQRTASPGAPTAEALIVGSASETLTTGIAPWPPAVRSAIQSAALAGQPPASEGAPAPACDAEKTTAAAAAPPAASAQRARSESIPLPSFLLTPKPVAATSGPSPVEMRAEAERERQRARLAAKLPLALGWLEIVS